MHTLFIARRLRVRCPLTDSLTASLVRCPQLLQTRIFAVNFSLGRTVDRTGRELRPHGRECFLSHKHNFFAPWLYTVAASSAGPKKNHTKKLEQNPRLGTDARFPVNRRPEISFEACVPAAAVSRCAASLCPMYVQLCCTPE